MLFYYLRVLRCKRYSLVITYSKCIVLNIYKNDIYRDIIRIVIINGITVQLLRIINVNNVYDSLHE